jgi:hypothetical protein
MRIPPAPSGEEVARKKEIASKLVPRSTCPV